MKAEQFTKILTNYFLTRFNALKESVGTTELYNSTKKRQHYLDIRHSSEYKTSDSDRRANRNIYPDTVTHDRMRLIDPKSGQGA